MPTLKKNFFYSFFLTTSSYLMSLVVFPYVSRTLGPTDLGLASFAVGTVGCFTLLATMGINTLGIREIARCRESKEELNNTYSSLFTLSLIFSFLAVIGFTITSLLIPSLKSHPSLILLGAVCIVAQISLIEWLYKGLENFRSITIRGIIIKILYVIAIFLFVKSPDDSIMYFALIVATYCINSIANITYARHFVKFSLKNIQLRKWLNSYFSLGSHTVLAAIYTTFNLMFLGIVTNETQVGYYTVSVKVFCIILGTISAFTYVLMPRMSALLADNKHDEFISHIKHAIDSMIVITIPAAIAGIIFSPQIVSIISGNDYTQAIIPMRILMPLVFLIGYEQIMLLQIMTPLNKDKYILYNCITIAIISIILNFCLVGKHGAIGSALVWLICEICLIIISQIQASRLIGLKFPFKSVLVTISACIPGTVLSLFIMNLPTNIWLNTCLSIIFFILTYSYTQLFIFRNGTFRNLIITLANIRHKHHSKDAECH